MHAKVYAFKIEDSESAFRPCIFLVFLRTRADAFLRARADAASVWMLQSLPQAKNGGLCRHTTHMLHRHAMVFVAGIGDCALKKIQPIQTAQPPQPTLR